MCARDKTKLLWIVKMFHAVIFTAKMSLIHSVIAQLNVPMSQNLSQVLALIVKVVNTLLMMLYMLIGAAFHIASMMMRISAVRSPCNSLLRKRGEGGQRGEGGEKRQQNSFSPPPPMDKNFFGSFFIKKERKTLIIK